MSNFFTGKADLLPCFENELPANTQVVHVREFPANGGTGKYELLTLNLPNGDSFNAYRFVQTNFHPEQALINSWARSGHAA